ncbi:MAG: AI-2E family transporter [Tissierellia bacterium]|nr:AI-2E family transporter [Tissierellia bacterium]
MSNEHKAVARLICLAALLLLIVLYFNNFLVLIANLGSALKPIFIGLFLALILNIPTSFFESTLFARSNNIVGQIKRPLSFLLALILIIAVLGFVFGMVIPQIAELIKVFIDSLPGLYDKGVALLNKITSNYPDLQKEALKYIPDLQKEIMKYLPDLKTILKNFTDKAAQLAGGTFNIITSFFGGIVTLLFAIIFSVYIIFGKDRLKERFDRIFRSFLAEEKRQELYETLKISNDTFSAFIVGQVTEAFILGILTALGMMVLKMPYPAMIASFVGLTALIPIVGAYLGAIFGFIMIGTVSLPQAIIYIIFQIILQQLEGNIVYPKVVGEKVGLPGIWVLVAVILGGSLFGIVGTFLAVPLFAIFYKLLFRLVEKREKAQVNIS